MWATQYFLKLSHIPSLHSVLPAQCIVVSRLFHVCCQNCVIYERHRKGGEKYEQKTPINYSEIFKEALRHVGPEFKKWVEERKDYVRGDFYFPPLEGDIEVAAHFNGPESLEGWVVSCDSDFDEGFTSAQLAITPQGYARFSGTLSTRLPKDGRIRAAGWCNMKCPPPMKSFFRPIPYNLVMYTHLVLRIRGDGRTYAINLHTPGYSDVASFDLFSYPLFTRGGPYWQVSKIPFAKFVQQYKGRVQDRQMALPREGVRSISLGLSDCNDGPFSLEIDYIGFEMIGYPDPDETAYEKYKRPHYQL